MIYIISNDTWFLLGMSAIDDLYSQTCNTRIVVYDRGDGKIIFLTLHLLYSFILTGNEMVEGFKKFLCTKHITMSKKSSLTLYKKNIPEIIKYMDAITNKKIATTYKQSPRNTRLSPLENLILNFILEATSVKDISKKLHMDVKIISNYKYSILRKLDIDSLADLLKIYNLWETYFQFYEYIDILSGVRWHEGHNTLTE